MQAANRRFNLYRFVFTVFRFVHLNAASGCSDYRHGQSRQGPLFHATSSFSSMIEDTLWIQVMFPGRHDCTTFSAGFVERTVVPVS
jgi:hypothetical protein